MNSPAPLNSEKPTSICQRIQKNPETLKEWPLGRAEGHSVQVGGLYLKLHLEGPQKDVYSVSTYIYIYLSLSLLRNIAGQDMTYGPIFLASFGPQVTLKLH